VTRGCALDLECSLFLRLDYHVDVFDGEDALGLTAATVAARVNLSHHAHGDRRLVGDDERLGGDAVRVARMGSCAHGRHQQAAASFPARPTEVDAFGGVELNVHLPHRRLQYDHDLQLCVCNWLGDSARREGSRQTFLSSVERVNSEQ
jgi:hypothetical protein